MSTRQNSITTSFLNSLDIAQPILNTLTPSSIYNSLLDTVIMTKQVITKEPEDEPEQQSLLVISSANNKVENDNHIALTKLRRSSRLMVKIIPKDAKSSIQKTQILKTIKETPKINSLKETFQSVKDNQSLKSKNTIFPKINKRICLNCSKSLLKVVPTELLGKFRHPFVNCSKYKNRTLSENWKRSLYCDEKCIRKYIEFEMIRQENECQHKLSEKCNIDVQLRDSISNKNKSKKNKTNILKQSSYKTREAMFNVLYERICVYPRYCIRDCNCSVDEITKDDEIIQPSEKSDKAAQFDKKTLSNNPTLSVNQLKTRKTFCKSKIPDIINNTANIVKPTKPVIKSNISIIRLTSINSYSKAETTPITQPINPAKLPEIPLLEKNSNQSEVEYRENFSDEIFQESKNMQYNDYCVNFSDIFN